MRPHLQAVTHRDPESVRIQMGHGRASNVFPGRNSRRDFDSYTDSGTLGTITKAVGEALNEEVSIRGCN